MAAQVRVSSNLVLFPLLITLILVHVCSCSGGSNSAGSIGISLQPATADPVESRSVADVLAEVDAAEAPEGVDGEVFSELKAELKRVISAREVSAVPISPPSGEKNKVTDLAVIVPTAGNYRLEWTYVNVGDYNQDKLVGVSDLTPVGVHFDKGTASPDWGTACLADGIADGLITVGDITPIGQNYNVRAAGYRVQRADSETGPWTTVYTVDFGEPGGTQAKRFMYLFSTLDIAYYRVVPTNGDSDGEPSNVVLTPGPPIVPEITDVTPQSGISGELTTFTATVTGSEPLTYNWDFNGGATPGTSTEREPEVTLGTISSYWATLTVSNPGGQDEFSFWLDVVGEFAKPVITDVDPRGGITGAEVTITPTYTCEGPPTFNWWFPDCAVPESSDGETATVTLGEPGEYECRFSVQNPSYDTIYFFTLSIWEAGNPPEITNVTPTEGFTGDVITINPVFTANGTPVYDWNFGGGATPNTSTEESPEITLGGAGEYSALLTIDNEYGSDTFPFTLTVLDAGGPPEVMNVCPCIGGVGSQITLHANVRGTTPISYAWDFGGADDPNTSTEESPTIGLGPAGTYHASLYVENDEGSDTYEFDIYAVDSSVGEAILAVPRFIEAYPGETVMITVECRYTMQWFQQGAGARVTFNSGCEYAPNSFNAGIPGGDPAAVDGPVWSRVAPEYLEIPDDGDLQNEIDLGEGRSAVDFWIDAFNGTMIDHAEGELFTFGLVIDEDCADGDEITIGLEWWAPELEEYVTYYLDSVGTRRVWDNHTNEGVPPIVVIRPEFTLTDPPGTGNGSSGSPYQVAGSEQYHFQVSSPTLGDVTSDPRTTYHLAPASAGTFSNGVLSISPTCNGVFTAQIDFDGYYSDTWYFEVAGGHPQPPDSLAAVPELTEAMYGTNVRVVVSMKDTANPFFYMTGVGVTMETGNDYVADSFNVGVPGGERGAVDGVWTLVEPSSFLLPQEFMITESDIGGGRQRIDFNIIPIGGHEITNGTGALFNFEINIISDVTLGFQEFQDVKRTYYCDDMTTEYYWGDISNDYEGIPNSIIVVYP